MNLPTFYRYLNIFKYYIYQLVNVRYFSIVDLVGRTGENGEKILIDSYYAYGLYPNSQGRSRYFIYSTSQAKSTHNGITIISDTVPWDGTQSGLSDFHNKVGETNPSGNGCWIYKTRDLNAYDTGVTGSSPIDEAPAIQRACTVLGTAGGGTLYFPSGSYRLATTIEITLEGVYIQGSGYKTLFTRANDYGDTWYFHGNSATNTRLNYCGMRDLRMWCVGLMTSGAMLRGEGLFLCDFRNIWGVSFFTGVRFDSVNSTELVNVRYTADNLYGGSITGRKYLQLGIGTGYGSGAPGCANLFVDHCQFRSGLASNAAGAETGLEILAADGIWIDNSYFGRANKVMHFNASNASDNFCLVYISNTMVDDVTEDGVYWSGATKQIIDVQFSNFTMKGGPVGIRGMYTDSSVQAYGVQINGKCSGFQQFGIQINSPNFRNIDFINFQVYGNSRSGANLYSAYEFADNTRDIKIVGGRAGGDTSNPASAGNTQYGIKAGTGHSNIKIIGVDLRKNSTGAFSSAAGNGVSFIDVSTDGLDSYTQVDRRSIVGTMDVTSSSNTTAALRVTQTGTANALEVEDSANPDSTPYIIDKDGRVGVGGAPVAGNVTIYKDVTGATTAYGYRQQGQVLADVTATAIGYSNAMATVNTAFTLSQYIHFRAEQGVKGAASTVTSQMGFSAASTLIDASNNYGFYGNIPSGANRWNFYGAGTARNWFAGDLTVFGGTAIPAGGTAGTGYMFSSTANFGVFFGSGSPTLSAAKGSLYLRSDGSGTSDRMYINTDGATTWTAVTTAA